MNPQTLLRNVEARSFGSEEELADDLGWEESIRFKPSTWVELANHLRRSHDASEPLSLYEALLVRGSTFSVEERNAESDAEHLVWNNFGLLGAPGAARFPLSAPFGDDNPVAVTFAFAFFVDYHWRKALRRDLLEDADLVASVVAALRDEVGLPQTATVWGEVDRRIQRGVEKAAFELRSLLTLRQLLLQRGGMRESEASGWIAVLPPWLSSRVFHDPCSFSGLDLRSLSGVPPPLRGWGRRSVVPDSEWLSAAPGDPADISLLHR